MIQRPGWHRESDGSWSAWLGNGLWALCAPRTDLVPFPPPCRGSRYTRVWRCSVIAIYGGYRVEVRAWSGVESVSTLREAKKAAINEGAAVLCGLGSLLQQYKEFSRTMITEGTLP